MPFFVVLIITFIIAYLANNNDDEDETIFLKTGSMDGSVFSCEKNKSIIYKGESINAEDKKGLLDDTATSDKIIESQRMDNLLRYRNEMQMYESTYGK